MACRGIQSVRGSFCRETLQGRAGKKRSLQYAEPTEADSLQDGEAHSDADGLHAFLAEQKQDELTKEERRSLVWLALKASLAVGGVFVLAAFLFLLFCVNVWFQ